jgi:hypothetical protein
MTARQKRGIRHFIRAIFGRVKVLFVDPQPRRSPLWYAAEGEDLRTFASKRNRDTWIASGPDRRLVRGNEKIARKARKEAVHV